MKNKTEPNINSWNLYQLARTVTKNSTNAKKDVKKTCPIIKEALVLAEKFKGKVCQLTSKPIRSDKASLQVAMIAATEMFLDLSTAIAAILAPPFLEGLIQREEIEQRFGVKTGSILEELRILQTCRVQDDTIRNYLHHPDVTSPHILAILLQIADVIRVHCSGVILENEDFESVNSSSQVLLQLKYFYIPLSHRMRLYEVQTKLADFWLKHTDTLTYYYITAKLGMTKSQRQKRLEILAEEIHMAITSHNIGFVMKKRIKSVYSIWNKIQNLNVSFEQIYDLSAVRIIVTGMKDKTLEEEKIICWKIFSILSSLYTPMYEIMRDWVSVPRTSGYESLHLTLRTAQSEPIEVQIRTERMDYIAEYGDAAHWKYKM
jgi:GTP pyrophosphokinase